MDSATAKPLQFDPPGPGTWTIDAVHFPRPVTRYWSEMHPAAVRARLPGADALLRDADRHARVRVPRRLRLQDRWSRLRRERDPGSLPAGRGGVRAQAVARAAARVGRDRPSRARSASTASCSRSIPDALSDDELVDYLTRCRDHHAEMIYQHMRFTAAPSVPTGDFLAHVGDWTGLPASELLGLLRGAAPVSAGASDELERLRAAVAADPAARSCSRPTPIPAASSTRCARATARSGAAASAYLDLVGYRLLDGFDISGRYALELPDALLRAIRVAMADDGPGDERRRGPHRGRPRAGARGAPGAVRRAARGGAADLQDPRRARRLQRHLGVRDHAPRGAGRRPPARRRRPAPRRRAPRRRRLRRDVRAGRGRRTGRRRTSWRSATRRRTSLHREGRPAGARRPARCRRRTRPGCRPPPAA